MLKSYMAFKESHQAFAKLKKKEHKQSGDTMMLSVGASTPSENQAKLNIQLRNSLIKQLTSFSYIASSAFAETKLHLPVDPFQLQVCKLMLDEILDQLKNEAEIVKKYKF
jgi:hypothetical protein